MVSERTVAEIAEEPGEMSRILLRGLPLVPHPLDVLFKPGYQVPLLSLGSPAI
ncbi:MAG TPA: hypothetical protein PK069_00690 [Methanolinea sp.]|nr:hypothetical protein [Methanolinea sp.]HQK54939.1 hypothetical protein [Methanolinea sp.]